MKKTIANRFTALLAAFLIAVCAVSTPAAAAATAALSVNSVTAAAGEDVVISINITGNSGLAAATFLLKYDHTKLTYKSWSAGPAAAGGLSSVNPAYAVDGDFSTINDSFVTTEDLVAAGSLLNVTFTVKPGWSGTSPVTLTTSTFAGGDYNEIEKTVTNGGVTMPAPAAPLLSAAAETPTNGSVTVTVTFPVSADAKEYKVGEGDWTAYTAPIILTANNTVYARYADTFGCVSATGSIVVDNIQLYVNIIENDSNDDGVFYRKLKLFGFYRNESLELGFETNAGAGAQVKWESSNVRKVVIGETSGIITNKGLFARSADITVTLTEGNTIVSDTVRVVFYKFGWQLNNLI